MRLADFDFELPEGLIATRPVHPRSAARLLVAQGNEISDRHMTDLPDLLRPGDLLVLNDTRVIPARLTGRRARGEAVARIEATESKRRRRKAAAWIEQLDSVKPL